MADNFHFSVCVVVTLAKHTGKRAVPIFYFVFYTVKEFSMFTKAWPFTMHLRSNMFAAPLFCMIELWEEIWQRYRVEAVYTARSLTKALVHIPWVWQTRRNRTSKILRTRILTAYSRWDMRRLFLFSLLLLSNCMNSCFGDCFRKWPVLMKRWSVSTICLALVAWSPIFV